MEKMMTKITGFFALNLIVCSAYATEHLIVQEDEKFSEIFLKIENNDVVKFVNLDHVNHHLRFKHRNLQSLEREFTPGSSQSVLFSKSGVYDIQCDLHPEMKLTVFVPHVDVVLNDER